MQRPTVRSGFTLIELIVVIGILAILLGIVLIAVNPARQFSKARNATRQSDVRAIANAVTLYATDNNGTAPAVIETNLRLICNGKTGVTCAQNTIDLRPDLVENEHLTDLPKDPLTGTEANTDYAIRRNSNCVIVVALKAELNEKINSGCLPIPSFALNFGGTGNYVDIANESTFDYMHGNSITIAAWIRPTDIVTGYTETIVAKGRDGTNQRNLAFTLAGASPGLANLTFYYRSTTGALNAFGTSTTPITENVWYHVAITYTYGTGSSAQLYINGSPVAASWFVPGNTGDAAPGTNDYTMRIGANHNSDSFEFFDGSIDDVFVFRRILSAQEINDLYRDKVVSADELIGEWRFHEGTGTTTKDSSSTGSDGTLVGAGWGTH